MNRPLRAFALLSLVALPASATEVHLPPQRDGDGSILSSTVSITLVDAKGRRVVAVNGTGLATEYRRIDVSDADGATVTLAPTSALAVPGGKSTWYRVSYADRPAQWLFQVPDTGTHELTALLGATSPAEAATLVHLPPQRDGDGSILSSTVSITLVDSAQMPVVALHGSGLVTEYRTIDVSSAGGATVALIPTPAMIAPGGGATWYRVSYAAQPVSYDVQVPASPATLELTDLIGATAIEPPSWSALTPIDPASLISGRLLTANERAALNAATSPPDAGNRILVADDIAGDVLLPPSTGAEEGWALTLDASLAPIWSAGADLGCTTLDCLEDGPSTLGTAGQVLATATGGATWEWITPPTTATQGEMEAGTEAALRQVSPLRVRQAIDARLEAPPAIGSSIPAAGNFTTTYTADVRMGVLPTAINAGQFTAYASPTSTGQTNAVRGFIASANHAGSGLAGTVQGFKGTAYTTFGGKATDLIGTDIEVGSYGNSSGYVTNMIGHDITVYPHAYTTNSYGIRIAEINGLGPISTAYGLWIGDQSGVGTVASSNIHSAGANSLNVFEGSIDVGGDLILGERADHASTPAAGHGYLWVEDTVPSTLVFTDDTGADLTLGSSGVSADADQALSLGSDDLPWLDTATGLSADERAALDEATAAPSETNRILVGTDTLTIPVYDLGNIGNATVPVTVADDDVRKIYTAATTSDGTLTITPPAAGMRVTTVYIDGDGEHETVLASTADLYWPAGKATALEVCYGERIELWATCLPTRCQMAARTSSVEPVYATATTDPAGANNAIVWTSAAAGLAGTAYSVSITDPATVSTPLTVTVAGAAYTIACAQDESSACISTAAAVISAMMTNYAGITGANAAGNDGTGVVAAVSATPLSCSAP